MAWDWDIGQWFTPPKSKSPWSAMTTGGTNKNAALERWGPIINSIGKIVGNAIYPGAGSVGSTVGGAIGMEGKDTGFQGTDKGWGNVGTTIAGAKKGYSTNPFSGWINSFTNYENSGNKETSLSQGLGDYGGENKTDISNILSIAARNFAGSKKGAFTEEHFNDISEEEFIPYLLEATRTYQIGSSSSHRLIQ